MRNRYLIIAMDLADLAAGTVFKRILISLKKFAECDVICPNMDNQAESIVNGLPCPEYRNKYPQIEWRLHKLLGYRPTELSWSRRAFKGAKVFVKNGHYDAVITFVYASNYSSLILGRKISNYTGLPWLVYSVDALPAPESWNRDKKTRNCRIKQLRDLLKDSDGLFMSNPIMLKYELDVLGSYKGFADVVFTPSLAKVIETEKIERQEECITFLYTGEIYAPRNIESVIEGFKTFTEKYNNSKLVFVGHYIPILLSGYGDLIQSGRLECFDYTSDLSSFFKRADILLDINADVRDDVFLSSKICNYISYDKPIITISEEGSPVRCLMSGVDSIVHCHHDAKEISDAMQCAVSLIGKTISDRNKLRHIFSPDEVARQFNDAIAAICHSHTNAE